MKKLFVTMLTSVLCLSMLSSPALATIYWSYVGDKIDLDSVTGGWENTDPNRVGITNRIVRLGQIDSGYPYDSQWRNYYPSTNTYSYIAPSWLPVRNIGLCEVGSTSTATLYTFNNPNYTWTLSLINNLPLPV